MTRSLIVACLAACVAVPLCAQDVPFFAAPAERGVVLRWVWGEGQRPAGYFVERRASSSSPWLRLTLRPLARIRDRTAARPLLGGEFERYAGLLFPDNPAAERSDPETFRGMLLLSADLNAGVAHVLGLRYDDVDATAGSAYEYRLIALTPSGERVVGQSDAVIAGTFRPSQAPEGMAVVAGPRGAALRWASAARFSGYHVYRSERRNDAAPRRLTDAPAIVFLRADGTPMEASATYFTDTLPSRDTAYYTVRGIDMFGRLSAPSAATAHVHRTVASLDAPVLVQTRIAGDTVVVTWQPTTGTQATRHQLWRADRVDGAFVRVGPPVRAPGTSQRDIGRPTRRVMWYRVTALDDAGHESDPSSPAIAEVPDRQPPPAPDSLTSVVDTGRVTLRWRQVPAADLRGYRVYRASDANGTFALLSPLPRRDAAFVDTIRARADHAFYYRITAVDSAFNESGVSALLMVRPPDVTAPSAPRIARVVALDGAVSVGWLANPEPDVTGYRLRYRTKGSAAWRDLPTGPAAQRADTILELAAGSTYEVTVHALDDAGNVSPPAPAVDARLPRRHAPPRPELRAAAFDARERGVVVTWAPAPGAREMLVLRRDESSQAWRLVGAAPASVTRFVDRTVRPAHRYEYIVRVRDGSGNEAESRGRRVRTPEAGS